MEKEVKITIPEGYEIDREKSTFERIVFKKQGLTYEDVTRKLFADKGMFYTTDSGSILHCRYCSNPRFADPNNATSTKQLEQILALNKLMNVAKYLNDRGCEGDMRWYLLYNKTKCRLDTTSLNHLALSGPAFNSEALARQAIEILGETEVKKAFGIFE